MLNWQLRDIFAYSVEVNVVCIDALVINQVIRLLVRVDQVLLIKLIRAA